ncbi:GNAT family N-acetyltransferase [Streptococcus loxodontisalivarius]|uniref:Ribosomal protein S18 acetylase RimI-like enzyme n=1 Tax=Streptococcus loxodontisalivarius TaxID=1349415 RepID=A0ABS2PTN5_9STRE|nr:GNAT family N-acetyltransferase [Streptococcus loxodontisalivarius]MBM7643411.1 ribosomal protein S18 acetylase RimI-like enzyme [Streptococcus loxodontisalivarius]
MADITLEKITAQDVSLLRDLAIETFTETFAHDNTAEQLQDYYASAYSLETMSAELEDPESLQFFVRVDGKVAGFLKVNWGQAQTEQELEDSFEIQRIYVLQAYQGLGLGKKLFEYALQLAQEKGFKWAWLGVWERNFKAQNFYAKYGFEKFAEHAFPVSEDKVDLDWLLKKSLG